MLSEKKTKKIQTLLRRRLSLFFYRVIVFIFSLFLVSVFFAWGEEYQVLVAGTATDSVVISLNVSSIISISTPADIVMVPDIAGTGVSLGEVSWSIVTNNETGWKLEVSSETEPAMKIDSLNYFNDYTETIKGTPESWNVSSSESEFGFSASGDYALSKYSNGNLFQGFSGNNKIEIAEDDEVTPLGGAETKVKFKAEVGSEKNQTAGNYNATIIATATTL